MTLSMPGSDTMDVLRLGMRTLVSFGTTEGVGKLTLLSHTISYGCDLGKENLNCFDGTDSVAD